MKNLNHTIDAFSALALQVKCQAVNRAGDRTQSRTIMQSAIQALGPQIAAARAFIGADCRLVVLPEYWLS